MTDAASSTFVYVTYIKTTPQRLWTALTDPAEMKCYWLGAHGESEFRPGSSWRLVLDDGAVADSGEIVKSELPKRLAIRRFTSGGRAFGRRPGDFHDRTRPQGEATKLIVTHTIAREKSKLIKAVSDGWPKFFPTRNR